MRLFCLPCSDGSATAYVRWRRFLPSWIDVQPMEWPGRGMRMDEPLMTDPHRLAEKLARELQAAPAAGIPCADELRAIT